MKSLRVAAIAVAASTSVAFLALPALAQDYAPVTTIAVGGTGQWDLIATDPAAHRAYVAHSLGVNVVDTASNKAIGRIQTSGYTHGIALAPAYGVGFATVGKSTASHAKPQHEVDVFNLKSLKIVKRISVQDDPDAITYDTLTHRIYVANADPQVATVIDVLTQKVVKTIALGGHPEFPISDGRGHVFYNINDTSKVVVFDARKATITKRFSLGECEGPTAIAYDAQTRRLLIPCDNGRLVILDATAGNVVTTLPIAKEPDGVAWDPATKTGFVATLHGKMTIVHQDGDTYSVAQTLALPPGSRTLGIDASTHKVYVPSSKFGPIPPGEKYPVPVPGSFGLVVVSQS